MEKNNFLRTAHNLQYWYVKLVMRGHTQCLIFYKDASQQGNPWLTSNTIHKLI